LQLSKRTTQILLVGALVIVLAVVAVFINKTDRSKEHVNSVPSKISTQQPSVKVASQDNSSVASAPNTRQASPHVGHTETAKSSSVDAKPGWRTVLASRELSLGVAQLTTSANPDDWALASIIGRMCIALTKPDDKDAYGGIGFDTAFVQLGGYSPAVISGIRTHASKNIEACGDLHVIGSEPYMRGLVKRAIDAGSPLAVASRIDSSAVKTGLTDEQLIALETVTKNTATREAWVASSRAMLGSALSERPEFQLRGDKEMQAMITIALCAIGSDCSDGSLIRTTACMTWFNLCGSGANLNEVATAELGANRLAVINDRAKLLATAISNGDLASMGFRKRTP
jgi:hypothetical protein